MEALKMEDIRYTVKDILSLPQGVRAELINGEIYMMAPPSSKHQKILSEICWKIKDYIKKMYIVIIVKKSKMKLISLKNSIQAQLI